MSDPDFDLCEHSHEPDGCVKCLRAEVKRLTAELTEARRERQTQPACCDARTAADAKKSQGDDERLLADRDALQDVVKVVRDVVREWDEKLAAWQNATTSSVRIITHEALRSFSTRVIDTTIRGALERLDRKK